MSSKMQDILSGAGPYTPRSNISPLQAFNLENLQRGTLALNTVAKVSEADVLTHQHGGKRRRSKHRRRSRRRRSKRRSRRRRSKRRSRRRRTKRRRRSRRRRH